MMHLQFRSWLSGFAVCWNKSSVIKVWLEVRGSQTDAHFIYRRGGPTWPAMRFRCFKQKDNLKIETRTRVILDFFSKRFQDFLQLFFKCVYQTLVTKISNVASIYYSLTKWNSEQSTYWDMMIIHYPKYLSLLKKKKNLAAYKPTPIYLWLAKSVCQ